MEIDVAGSIRERRLVAILRGVLGDDALRTAEALARGGVFILELTLDHADPGKARRALEDIRRLRDRFAGDLAVGAGTVLSAREADQAADAGALFLVSPDANPDVIRRTKELGIVSIPGAMTPTEIAAASRAGADFVKLFPAAQLGPKYLEAVRAPLPHIPLVAVGGVDASNARAFLAAGAAAVGAGGKLADRKAIAAGDFAAIERNARELVAAISADAERRLRATAPEAGLAG